MWYAIFDEQVKIRVLVKPNAKKAELIGINEQGLLVSVHAKPQQGAANKELTEYLARLFGVPKTQISLRKGHESRYKQVVLPLNERVQNALEKIRDSFPLV